MSIRHKYLFFVLSLAFIFACVANPAKALAYSNSRLMDDPIFDNYSSMSEQAIRDFIMSRPNTCLAKSGAIFPEPKSYSEYGPNNVDAARVIYVAAQEFKINPQVIIATLQKEQSLITDNDCYDPYNNPTLPKAMGMGCFEGKPCPIPEYAGFHQQVTKGSWQLKFNQERANGNVGWRDNGSYTYSGPWTKGYRRSCASCANIYRDGYWTIDGKTIYIETGATASFYSYTPHLGQSFPSIFEGWFGPTVGSLVRTPNNATVYLESSGTKYPISSGTVLENFYSLGPIRFVPDNYIDALTTGSILNNFVRSQDGSIYLVNAGIKMGFTSCSGDIVNYGYSCDPPFVQLSDAHINKLANGPNVTKLIKSNSNGTIYFMSAGKKRPIQSWDTIASLNIPPIYNVLSQAGVNMFPTGSIVYKPGKMVKLSSDNTVYVVKDLNNLYPISSFIYINEMGLKSSLSTISSENLAAYSIETTQMKNKVSCSGLRYLQTKGKGYLVSDATLNVYRYENSQFVDGGALCTQLNNQNRDLGRYLRVSNGTIYYVNDSGQKQAFTSFTTFSNHQDNNGNPGYIEASDFFANSLPNGTNL